MKYTLIDNLVKQPEETYKEFFLRKRNVHDTAGFLRPTRAHLHSPYLLDNIEKAAHLLIHHLDKKSKIFLQIDSDVDGYTSAAIFYNYILKTYGEDANIKWRTHDGKEHGIILDTVGDVDLVVIIDAGTNQCLEHAQLRERGVDILILDHHECEVVNNDAVIVNNQLSINYPNKYLSGAGIAYKFCQVLDDILKVDYANDHLDLVAIGLVSDMMNLTEIENRYLVKQGLANITNAFIKEIIEKQSYSISSNIITPTHVSFYIAPLINALVRVGTNAEKDAMFLAFVNGNTPVQSNKRGAGAQEIETIATQVTRSCVNARNRQNRAKEKALESIEAQIEKDNLLDNKILFVPLKNGVIEKNLSGLVAGQLVTKYKRPVLLGHEKDKSFSGSGRGNDRSLLKELKNFLNDLEIFNYVEGHQNAFGFQVDSTQIDTFLEKSNELLKEVTFDESVYEVDFILNGKTIEKELLRDVSELNDIYGKGVEEPLIAVENIVVTAEDVVLMGTKKNTIKIQAYGQTYIMFRTSEELYDDLLEQLPARLSIVGKANANVWGGETTYQIIISDYNVVESNICYF